MTEGFESLIVGTGNVDRLGFCTLLGARLPHLTLAQVGRLKKVMRQAEAL